MKLTILGHASVLIETEKNTVLIDPGLSAFNQEKKYEIIEKLDYIILTHGHMDHVKDVTMLQTLFNDVKVYGMVELVNLLKSEVNNLVSFNLGAKIKLEDNLVFNVVPASHSSSYKNNYSGLACGLVVQKNEKSIYITGDTALDANMKIIKSRYKNIDHVISPIDGKYNLDVDDVIYMMKKYFKKAKYDMYHLGVLENEMIEEIDQKLIANQIK